MIIVAGQEQRLSDDTLVVLGEQCDRFGIPRPEDVREGAVHGTEIRQKLRFLSRAGTDGEIKGARGTDRLLHQVGQRPAPADIGCVGGIGLCDAGGVVD